MGSEMCIRDSSTGKRGRTKQSKATNLIGRLRDYSDHVWRFMPEPNVPFTNNLAEQTGRMPKVKQRVSGCFRTLQGAKNYCIIRSYCATMHKQGANILESLVAAFKRHTSSAPLRLTPVRLPTIGVSSYHNA